MFMTFMTRYFDEFLKFKIHWHFLKPKSLLIKDDTSGSTAFPRTVDRVVSKIASVFTD